MKTILKTTIVMKSGEYIMIPGRYEVEDVSAERARIMAVLKDVESIHFVYTEEDDTNANQERN